MRVVILTSSAYSETGCAIAMRLALAGYVPAGALALSSLNSGTLLRKVGQWGTREVVRYARSKVGRRSTEQGRLHNPFLEPLLKHEGKTFRSLREVAAHLGFPLETCANQNSPAAVAVLKKWSPDVIVFAGGNLLRQDVLGIPRMGVLNAHLGLLPEVRGMSSPEWSLLNDIPAGVTIHSIDAGIDTGPILQRCEYTDVTKAESLGDLRNRLIAFGVEKMAGSVAALDRGTVSAAPQPDRNHDRQFFVMHEWLQSQAAARLSEGRIPSPAGARNE